jgi:type IV pilus assembly protein PilW
MTRFFASYRRAAQRGLTMIELMVALVISAILTLAIFAVMSTFEGRKRTTTSVNDASQAGNYGLYMVDKWVRSAGSGFVQAGPQPNADTEERKAMVFGCRLLMARSGTTTLPRGSALPQPFENINTGTAGLLRLAPAIIAPSQSRGLGFGTPPERSDVLMVMGGSAGFGEVPIALTGAVSASTMPVANAVSIATGDMLLLADQPTAPGNVEDCMMQQVGGATTSPVGLSGTYAATAVSGVSQGIYDDSSVAIKLGNPTTSNPPNFFAIGVGDNATLMSYDLLEVRSPAVQAVADNVLELHAVYGVDTDDNGTVDTYIDPRTTTGEFRMANLMSGSVVAAGSIDKIKAIRVALILRSNLQEKAQDAIDNPFTPATLTVFSEVGLTRTRTLTADERRFRYRVIEATIPVRNAFLAPRG